MTVPHLRGVLPHARRDDLSLHLLETTVSLPFSLHLCETATIPTRYRCWFWRGCWVLRGESLVESVDKWRSDVFVNLGFGSSFVIGGNLFV